jgi:hypothetical protein
MVISTKLPIVNNLIEIIILIQTYQNNMKMVLDRYTALQEGFGVKLRHMQSSRIHVRLKEMTCKESQKT